MLYFDPSNGQKKNGFRITTSAFKHFLHFSCQTISKKCLFEVLDHGKSIQSKVKQSKAKQNQNKNEIKSLMTNTQPTDTVIHI